MIRLILLLCVGMYLSLMVLGEDHGQKRYGLMMADQLPQVAEPTQPAAPEADKVVFIPAQTTMEPAPVATSPVTTVVADTTQPLPDPVIPGGKLFTVASLQANVREGPGKTFGVLSSLTKGEQVLVVEEVSPTDGWSKVRLEGDGVEGYIATRLLIE
jgi:hypothetical protein